jgi:epoxyqueuosine reductase QueG
MCLDGRDLYGRIQNQIVDLVVSSNTETEYRPPLVAMVSAHEPRFAAMSDIVPGHLVPQDLLPEAETVCSFFVPFARSVVASNRSGDVASEAWARAYVETNGLLSHICQVLESELSEIGIAAAWAPPTHNFDPQRLISAWSHKSIAAIAGLGKFGHHKMLITEAGCAGRFGSIVLDVEVDLPPRQLLGEVCSFDRGCRACVKKCPVGALTEDSFDRHHCYEMCLDNDARFPDWLADVCGKCATGPCAMRPVGDGTCDEPRDGAGTSLTA